MTKDSSFKRHVRERMTKTGESYAAARGQVVQKRDRVRSARTRLADTADRPAEVKVTAATGKPCDAWFSILDRWGARERKHGEIAAYLGEEHGVPGWWAQSITMWCERSRGMRLKHLLKRAGKQLLPPETLARRKMGFGVPVGNWMRGELRSWVEDLLLSPRALKRGYFQPEALRQFLQNVLQVKLFAAEIYFFTRIPAQLDPGEVAAVVGMALVLSFLATLYPSWRAARLDPVEGLRYE